MLFNIHISVTEINRQTDRQTDRRTDRQESGVECITDPMTVQLRLLMSTF